MKGMAKDHASVDTLVTAQGLLMLLDEDLD